MIHSIPSSLDSPSPNSFISKVVIESLWGRTNIKLDLNKNVNFLIGDNGTGKTTVINLIAATLQGDFITLDRTVFKKITITLSRLDKKKKPSVCVQKKDNRYSPYQDIIYKIKSSYKAKPKEYSLNREEEGLAFRSSQTRFLRTRFHRFVMAALNDIINVSWLTIHRTPSQREYRGKDSSYDTAINEKIATLSNEFVRYFASLSQKADLETEKFQKSIFLSLLKPRSKENIFSEAKELIINEERKALSGLFEQIEVPADEYSDPLAKHYEMHKRITKKLLQASSTIAINEVDVIFRSSKLHSIVQKWKKLGELKREIMGPKSTFFEVINRLLKGKSLEIDEKNELIVNTDHGDILSIKQLSSGEKQLFIFLGETLLQNKKPLTYIADEPELSLHLNWQVALIDSILMINPSAQILFATHSPDIVSKYQDSVIRMEDINGL